MLKFIYLLFFLAGAFITKVPIFGDTILNYTLALILMVSPLFIRKIVLTKQNTKYKKNILLSNVSSEFEELYNSLYFNEKSKADKVITRIKKLDILLILFTLIVPGIIFFICVQILILNLKILPYISIGIVLCLIAIIMNLYTKRRNINYTYQKEYKENIIKNLVKLVNMNLTFNDNCDQRISSIFKEANFNIDDYNTSGADDYIEGYIDENIMISACDFCAEYRKDSTRIPIFEGIFAYTKCTKNIESYIRIAPNTLKFSNSKNSIKLDSDEFEKHFDVYSDNKIITLQLLTSDIMTALMDFHIKYNLDFELAFKNDTIYMRFFTGPMFEPRLYGKSTDKQLLFTYYSILQFVANVTKKVNKTLENLEI